MCPFVWDFHLYFFLYFLIYTFSCLLVICYTNFFSIMEKHWILEFLMFAHCNFAIQDSLRICELRICFLFFVFRFCFFFVLIVVFSWMVDIKLINALWPNKSSKQREKWKANGICKVPKLLYRKMRLVHIFYFLSLTKR